MGGRGNSYLTSPGARARHVFQVRREKQPSNHKSEKLSSPFTNVAKYLALGLEVPSAIAGSLILGYFLDAQFGTAPWLMVICAVLGFVGAVVRLIQYLRYFANKTP
jgi:F0F1-type ATP synthase assembly protein I